MSDIIQSLLSALPDEIIFKYIIFYSQQRYTGITAYRNDHYSINNLKIDIKRNIEKLFTIDDVDFERIWAIFLGIFETNELDLFETLYAHDFTRFIISKNKNILTRFLVDNITHLESAHQKALRLYLDLFKMDELHLFDANKFHSLFQIIFGESLEDPIGKILVHSGLVVETIWISSKGNYNGLHLSNIPFSSDIITEIKNEALSNVVYPSFHKEFKNFKKRMNYKKETNYILESIGIDLFLSGYDSIEKGLNLIDINGSSKFLDHPHVVTTTGINPFLIDKLQEYVNDSARFLISKLNWVNKICEDEFSRFSFLEEKTNLHEVYTHEIDNYQHHLIVAGWFRYSLPLQQNTILVLGFHQNIKSLIETVFASGLVSIIIAFGGTQDVILIGDEKSKILVDKLEQKFKSKKKTIKKKLISLQDYDEDVFFSKELEPSIVRKFTELIEKQEEMDEKLDSINKFLQEKLSSDYEKIKIFRQQLKDREITKGKFYWNVGKIVAKHLPIITGLF